LINTDIMHYSLPMMMKKAAVFLLASLLAPVLVGAEDSTTLYRVLRDGKWGAISSDGVVVVEPTYDYVFPFVNGLTVVRMGDYQTGKRAYLSADGTFITGFDFDRAYHFFGDLAVVNVNGKEAYVDRNGKLVSERKYDSAADMRRDYATVRIGSSRDARWGAVNSMGELSIPVEFDRLSRTAGPDTFIFRRDGRYGLVRGDGVIVVEAEYDNLYSSGDHLIGVEKTGSQSSYSILDPNGLVLFRPEDPQIQIRSISRGFVTISLNAKLGLIDFDGRTVIEPRFDRLRVLSDNLLVPGLSVGRGFRYSVIDTSGRELIAPDLQWVAYSDDYGFTIIMRDSLYGCMNEHGEIVVSPEYDQMGRFSEGYAVVRKGDKWGYIDTSGAVAIELTLDRAYDFSEGLAVFRVGNRIGGKRGYIDTNGSVVIEPQFDWAYSFENGIAHVAFGGAYDGVFGYIDTTGSYVWEPAN
jgi:hypothetical protein